MRESAGRSFAGGSDRERAFRAASRHSRVVRFCRRAIPVALIALLGAVAAAAYFKPLELLTKLPVDASHTVFSGTSITMELPRLGGYTRDGRPYDLTARAGAQDLANPGVLQLKDIVAHVAMQDKSKLELHAATGVYDTKSENMMLRQDIVLVTSTGYTVHLDEAKIDNKGGRIVSDKRVAVTMTNGTVNANGLEVLDGGSVIRFTNGVETYLVPQSSAGAAAAPASAVGQ
jgi:lipopolysaccharide export system protein LptC